MRSSWPTAAMSGCADGVVMTVTIVAARLAPEVRSARTAGVGGG